MLPITTDKATSQKAIRQQHGLAARLKALGHPTRLLFVEALSAGTLCVCELEPLVQADLSTVSRHLAVLRHAGLVSSRREGAKVLYSLEPAALAACAEALEALAEERLLS